MKHYPNIYFLGIGGIGMSALARLFLHQGCRVAGYDRTCTPLTEALSREGAEIHYEESVEAIPSPFRDPEQTLVVYTPAVPTDHAEYCWLRDKGFRIDKRSQILGFLSEGSYVMAVAGTHGKTTTSTLVAWLNHAAVGEGNAILGGISKNFSSNLVLGEGDRMTLEADEFDRSFLRLKPHVAIITSADPDHLDIYGTYERMKEAFSEFITLIRPEGSLIIKQGVDLRIENPSIKVYRYAYNTRADFYARNIRLQQGGYYRFDLQLPDGELKDCTLGVPGWVNIENAVAAVAALWCAAKGRKEPFDGEAIRRALASFQGVKRRFEFYINTPERVYMDDYAHHPRELSATITSLKQMFPGRKLLALFQPHLYTRTRDLYPEFAEALSLADEVVLLPIYPAREAPIEGINSELIAHHVTVPCTIVEREVIAEHLAHRPCDVVVSFGAGNIDAYCQRIAKALTPKTTA